MSEQSARQYHYLILQPGELPLTTDGKFNVAVEHRCTSVLIWPEGQRPCFRNTVLTDPCFTPYGFRRAEEQLEQLRLSFDDIGHVFMTHQHRDHILNLPLFISRKEFAEFPHTTNETLSGIRIRPYPGHSPEQQALVFRSPADRNVYVVGDAVLNLQWLKGWGYYWPNYYVASEIIQTWKSLAQIFAEADLIIPGHGQPIAVTVPLVRELLSTFVFAKYAGECPQVEQTLNTRLQQLLGRN